jgi:hypothetical protein
MIADLKDWRKPNPKKNDPGKTADAYAGTYNVLLPGSPGNSDSGFPLGIGYGQVKITNLGSVVFVGKLGDGSPAKASAVLVKRNSGGVTFPLFVALDKKLGSAAGIVTYDDTLPDSDITGAIDWVEPATKGVEPQPFAGQIDLHGSRYRKPRLQANGSSLMRSAAPASLPRSRLHTPSRQHQSARRSASASPQRSTASRRASAGGY